MSTATREEVELWTTCVHGFGERCCWDCHQHAVVLERKDCLRAAREAVDDLTYRTPERWKQPPQTARVAQDVWDQAIRDALGAVTAAIQRRGEQET